MSAWCASTASARRRCLVPSGDTYVHVQFLRDASISPRGNTVQPCMAAPCHSRSSISSSVKDCGGLPRVAEDSVAEHAAAAAGAAAAGGGAAVVVVRRDIFPLGLSRRGALAPSVWSGSARAQFIGRMLRDQVMKVSSKVSRCRVPASYHRSCNDVLHVSSPRKTTTVNATPLMMRRDK